MTTKIREGTKIVVIFGNMKKSFTLVSPNKVDLERRRISYNSPIGSALLNKCAGETVAVKTPSGVKNLKIVDVI